MLNLHLENEQVLEMDVNRKNIISTTTLIVLFALLSSFGFTQENPLVEAIKRFDAQDYQTAEKLLQPLIEKDPDQLMINYFYGASRTENGHYGTKEIEFLQKGSLGETPLKTDYYLAIQYHALKNWEKALEYYHKYETKATPEELKDLDIANKIKQCKDEISPFEVPEAEDILPQPVVREAADTDTKDSVAIVDSLVMEDVPDSKSIPVSDIPEEETRIIPPATPIDFELDGEITYIEISNFRTNEGLQAFLNWQSSKHRLDSLNAKMDEWRSDYAKAQTSAQRNELGQKIISVESDLFSLQNDTQNVLRRARLAETNYWNSVPEREKIEFIDKLKKLSAVSDSTEELPLILADTTLETEVNPEVLQAIVGAEPVATKTESKIELVYKIQIGAYSRGVPAYIKSKFDKLSFIRKIDKYTDENGVVVYTTGNLTNLEDAVKMQNQVRQEGIQDAFVVPYFNGKRITLKEAKLLESEQ